MNLGFVIKETIKGLRVNYRMGLTSILITSFSLFVLFLFFILTFNAFDVIRKASDKIEMDIYLKKNLPENTKEIFIETLENYAGVQKVRLIDSKKAKQEFVQKFPEYVALLSLFQDDIFPERIVVHLKPMLLPLSYKTLKKNIGSFSLVDEVIFGEEWIFPFSKFILFLFFIDVFLIILLIFLLGIVMVQTLRLTILRRKEVVNLLEIIGASESTIRGPFVFEGSFYGICGGLISGCSLFFLNIVIRKLFNIHLFYMDLVFSVSLLFGLLLGFVSSLIAVSQRERQGAW